MKSSPFFLNEKQMSDNSRLYSALVKQIEIMAKLRNKDTGCPWDIVQDFDTIAPYTIEEAYEVQDAINRRDFGALKEELGDLLFQVAFHSRMAEESQMFDFADVTEALNQKMIDRHPHVFGGSDFATPSQVLDNWEKLKSKEREAKIANDPSVLADVALNLPALTRALKLSKRAARVGFDWAVIDDVFEKLEEELAETKEAIIENDKNHIEEEVGDCLFVIVNLARKCGVDPEQALMNANRKFERRFRAVEKALINENKEIAKTPLQEMEDLWLKAKLSERDG